jgi:hypothetical protein
MKQLIKVLLLISLVISFSGCGTDTNISIVDSPLYAITIDNEHQAVHEGKAFRNFYKITIAAGDTRSIQIYTGEYDLHFKERDFVVSDNNDEIYYSVFINSTITTNGTTEVPVYNSNENFIGINDGTTRVYLDPVINTRGLNTDLLMIPSTGRTGGSTGDSFEWIYKANSTLVVDIENTGNKAIEVLVRYKFYIIN